VPWLKPCVADILLGMTAPGRPALDGIRVLDLATIVFGPYAAQLLADYGADVIKIESPHGDPVRQVGPALEPDMAALYLGMNRNKRSVVLDLKQQAGREALLTLVDTADVLIHSMRPQKMAGLGLDPDTVRARNPRLVYADLYGFGEGGAYAGRPAYDDIIQGLSGAADMMARQSGEPRYLPTTFGDKVSSLFAAQAILAALFQRERTGRGQRVEVPMFETVTAFNLVEHFFGRQLADAATPEAERPGAGYWRALDAWRRPFATLDGYVCLLPYSDDHWRRLADAGYAEFALDPRFATLASRTVHINALYERLGSIIAAQSTGYWLELCDRIEIPAARVNSLDELEADPHLADVGMFVDIDDGAHRYRFPRSPVRMADSSVPPAVPPRLGADTEEVLREAGVAPDVLATVLGVGGVRNRDTDQPAPDVQPGY
jgi:crotonobetainyl-CoA:carnitine CoA-transferase CaiB-like acyl-CoA transferase